MERGKVSALLQNTTETNHLKTEVLTSFLQKLFSNQLCFFISPLCFYALTLILSHCLSFLDINVHCEPQNYGSNYICRALDMQFLYGTALNIINENYHNFILLDNNAAIFLLIHKKQSYTGQDDTKYF